MTARDELDLQPPAPPGINGDQMNDNAVNSGSVYVSR